LERGYGLVYLAIASLRHGAGGERKQPDREYGDGRFEFWSRHEYPPVIGFDIPKNRRNGNGLLPRREKLLEAALPSAQRSSITLTEMARGRTAWGRRGHGIDHRNLSKMGINLSP
jgi:hypothetical protein